MESTWYSNGAVKLHAVVSGPENGPLVILLHGFPEFWYGWHRQIPALAAAGYRVVALDQRGYNLSDKPAGVEQYTVDKLAADVLAVADALGQQSFLLAGHDWGGVVAWWIAANYAERLKRVAILNVPHPSAFRGFLLNHPSQILKSSYMAWFQVPVLPEALMSVAGYRTLSESMTRSARPGTFTADDFRMYRQAWSEPGALTAMLNWYRAAVRQGWPEPKQLIVRVPTLLLWGMQDSFIRPELADRSMLYCTDPKLVRFPTATHWIQHEEAERVNSELVSFFGAA